MDMKLFRNHLANKQKILNEATPRQSRVPLINTNKFLDRSLESLDSAIEQLEEYLEVADGAKELSPEDRRETKDSIKELEKLRDALERASDNIPTVS